MDPDQPGRLDPDRSDGATEPPSWRADVDELPPLVTATELTARPRLRTDYLARLSGVDDLLTGGALLIRDLIPELIDGVLDADRTIEARVHAVADEVRRRCRTVEDDGFLLLALQAPVSSDLRRLIALLRMVHHVERAAKMTVHIADSVEHLDARLLPGEVRDQLRELAVHSHHVFSAGLDAWRRRDALAVRELERADRDVDALRTDLLMRSRDLEERPEVLVTLGLLALYFERIADHGVEFAQHACFAVTGRRIETGR
jgi:phosphate transport system protein